MKKQFGATTFEFLFALVFLLGCGGWLANIVKIVGTMGDILTGMFIARCIGVFVVPVGAVLGFF